ncbi:MAG: glycerophosphodiester phosphodiesterase [Acidobacteriota bacterium]|nr:glycerophosphodiester phosphodiesterase [Acidobacteriota bacterium]
MGGWDAQYNLGSLEKVRARWQAAVDAGVDFLATDQYEALSAVLKRVLVHGHRGARAMRPENTIPAFQYAISAGVDALELDMAVTKDNVLVVSHDPLLNPAICRGPRPGIAIHQLTLAELREYDCGAQKNPNFPKQVLVPGTRMPTLDEVFDLAGEGNFDFNIETKSFPDKAQYTPAPDAFARLVLDAIRRHRLESRIILQSFDFRTLHEMERLDPKIRRSALYQGTDRDFVKIAREADATIISPYYKLVTPENVRAAHEVGLQVVPWTADTPEDWKMLVNAGVDAIISDDPAALILWLQKNR